MLIKNLTKRGYNSCKYGLKDNLCKILIVRKLTFIASLFVFSFLNVNANAVSIPDDTKKVKPDDDKKSKVKRDDTTTFVSNLDAMNCEETPDTTVMLFPSHDLYASWDTSSAHPYNFYEQFKVDSVVITLLSATDNQFSMPFKGPITSNFGWRRYRPHYGTDIDLETGDTVVSSFDGMIRLAKYCNGYGNCVIIRHNNGLETVYGHLSKILVEPGQKITSGTLIGLGGNTGRSYGAHLHFEMRYLGQALDTEDFIDYEKGELKSTTFTLRKSDVENKYDLRALHSRHKRDIGLVKKGVYKNQKYVKGSKNVYKVRNGDSLGKIAKRNHTTVKALCKKNGLKPTSTLRLGQKIKI